MYTKKDLYENYNKNRIEADFSESLPDVTKKTTLEGINNAINLCEKWDSALDIGCGNGHYLVGLSTKFRKNVGVEIDKYSEHDDITKKFKNITFYSDEIENYPEEDKFDFVLLSDIFEHIPNINSFIQKISRLQNNNGIVYITTPNPLFCGPAAESDIYYKKNGYHGHIKHYTKKEIVDLMKKANYEPEFYFFEETELRQEIKRIAKAISRRDKRWSKSLFYKVLRPILIPIAKLFFKVLEVTNYNHERKNSSNHFDTRTISMAFKKIEQ